MKKREANAALLKMAREDTEARFRAVAWVDANIVAAAINMPVINPTVLNSLIAEADTKTFAMLPWSALHAGDMGWIVARNGFDEEMVVLVDDHDGKPAIGAILNPSPDGFLFCESLVKGSGYAGYPIDPVTFKIQTLAMVEMISSGMWADVNEKRVMHIFMNYMEALTKASRRRGWIDPLSSSLIRRRICADEGLYGRICETIEKQTRSGKPLKEIRETWDDSSHVPLR